MIEVLVGMVASGKSGYAKKRAEEGWIIINDDAIVMALHANNYLLYNPKIKKLYKNTSVHMLLEALALNLNVVIDSTNLTKTRRMRWISIAENNQIPIDAIVFPMFQPEVHAQRRFNSDPRGYDYNKWLEVAKLHYSESEMVDETEGFNRILYYDLMQ